MKRSIPVILAILPVFLAAFPPALSLYGQSTPFLTDQEIRMLTNEISGDRAFEHIRWLSHWHRDSGMEGYFNAADYVMNAAREAGLEEVRFIEQPREKPDYTARAAELWMIEPLEIKLADIGDHALYLADGSHSADTTAELLWIGNASDKILETLDVSGKIVLTNVDPDSAVKSAVWRGGAVGVVSFPVAEKKSPLDYPDQIAWKRIPITPPEGKKGTFAFVLPYRKGDNLRRILQTEDLQDFFASGRRTRGGRVVLRARVVTEIGESPGHGGFVEAWIRGGKYSDQQIVLTSHLQEEQGSANDNGSSCGNLLELGRTFKKLIAAGKMSRPVRDIRFWWTDEIDSEYRYFRDHPDAPKKILANINQDMTGARQSLGSRAQHLIFAPHSRTSFLDAVFESIGTYVIQTNNSYLAANRQGGLPRPHSRPIYASRGTRESYRAVFVPYFDSSDHKCFVEGIIGVPAVGLINWDDDFIHSSDDDLDKIDATQLQRNNFLVAAMTFFLSRAEADDVALLAGETYAQGCRRMVVDFSAALEGLKSGGPEDAAAWKDADLLMEQGLEREIRALNSARVFAGQDSAANHLLDTLIERMKYHEKAARGDLQSYYRQLYGSNPREIQFTTEELAARGKIPLNPQSQEIYFNRRKNVKYKSKTLHALMRDEVYNFVDGKRSYYDIYKAVRAEALAGGSWYYGDVRLHDVVDLLDAAVAAEALLLK